MIRTGHLNDIERDIKNSLLRLVSDTVNPNVHNLNLERIKREKKVAGPTFESRGQRMKREAETGKEIEKEMREKSLKNFQEKLAYEDQKRKQGKPNQAATVRNIIRRLLNELGRAPIQHGGLDRGSGWDNVIGPDDPRNPWLK